MAIDYSGLKYAKGLTRAASTLLKQRQRAAFERATRTFVRERDGGRCRVCDARAAHLHYLQPRSKQRRWTTSSCNIVSLCARCHGFVHAKQLRLDGNPDSSLYWEWVDGLRSRSKSWGYSRPPHDPYGPGKRFHGRVLPGRAVGLRPPKA